MFAAAALECNRANVITTAKAVNKTVTIFVAPDLYIISFPLASHLSQNATELVFHSRAPWPPSRGHGLFEVIFNHIGDLRFPTTTPSGAEPFAELSVPSTRSARTRKAQRETPHSGEASGVPLGIIRNLQACAQSGCEVSLKR